MQSVGRFTVSPRLEALRLYRDVLRVVKVMNYPDEKGRLWSDVLRESTRQDFERNRFERDPEVIARLLVSGRGMLEQVQDKMFKKAEELMGPGESAKGRPARPATR
eukprot:TRINITY_DN3221_c0_g1_i2.p3 TRINITY_DN3221_c0_g1~~TRINITY_DN3221_c0_g1_i2.p3  ORF type:complete len:106 (-),score=17.51 TRINITY_DN3221_c0_g1_i2:346-663(-)